MNAVINFIRRKVRLSFLVRSAPINVSIVVEELAAIDDRVVAVDVEHSRAVGIVRQQHDARIVGNVHTIDKLPIDIIHQSRSVGDHSLSLRQTLGLFFCLEYFFKFDP